MSVSYPEWKNNGKIKIAIIVGTRPEIIRLSAVINKCRKYFDAQLWHTGQNYDYNLNGVFFKDLGLAARCPLWTGKCGILPPAPLPKWGA